MLCGPSSRCNRGCSTQPACSSRHLSQRFGECLSTVIAGLDPAIHDTSQYLALCRALPCCRSSWMPGSSPGMTPGMATRTDLSRFNCQTANAPPPVLFVEAPGRPVFLLGPLDYEGGWRAKWRNHCSLSCRTPSREHGRLSARHRSVFLPAPAALFVDRASRRPSVSQAPGRQPVVAAGRSPGAARVRAVRNPARPQAPHPAPPSRRLMMTPLTHEQDR
jgi:hypothetical protein